MNEETKEVPQKVLSAAQRCHRLRIIPSLAPKAPPGAKHIQVLTPESESPERILVGYPVRTPQDEARVKQHFMGRYRIPQENVEDRTEQPEER